MVYYFEATGASEQLSPPVMLYMGKHKEENEDLIKWGLPTDVWFHVDNLSSAHVYLRLPQGWNWKDIPHEILMDCAQLTKANSIQGNKRDNVTVIYTPWSNLHKTNGMEAGQVGFKKEKEVRKIFVDTRVNNVINRLNKTKQERFPDLQKEKVEYEKTARRMEEQLKKQRAKQELELARERKQLAYQKDHAYEDLMSEDNVRHTSNQFRSDDWEDDFW